jgi:hypothetical protein
MPEAAIFPPVTGEYTSDWDPTRSLTGLRSAGRVAFSIRWRSSAPIRSTQSLKARAYKVLYPCPQRRANPRVTRGCGQECLSAAASNEAPISNVQPLRRFRNNKDSNGVRRHVDSTLVAQVCSCHGGNSIVLGRIVFPEVVPSPGTGKPAAAY